MKILGFVLPFLVLLLSACTGSQNDEIARLNREIADLQSMVGPPPSSLDRLYPPESQAPVFLIQMFAMATPLSGVAVDVFEGDVENAKANFERFSKAYDETARLVPEWVELYPKQPVDSLGAALAAGDQDRLMAAFEEVGGVCHSCHVDHMARVQQRYRWPAFSDLVVTDPVSGEEAVWAHFMRSVEFSFTGIQIDLEEGQLDGARGHFRDFNKKFQEMREGCEFCHSTERAYFVDPGVQGMMDELGTALDAASPDPQRIAGLLQGIGQESCGKCHLVHAPSALAKARWNVMGAAASAGAEE